MSELTVLAQSDDRPTAVRLTDRLGAAGLAVRLDLDPTALPAGHHLFCWSGQSARDAGFAELAAQASAAETAIGVRLAHDVDMPVDMPAYDYPARQGPLALLMGDLFLSDIVAAVRAKQQNTFPPLPTARSRLLRRRLWTLAVGAASALGLVIGLEQGLDSRFLPRFNERAAWAELVEKGAGCEDLRMFLNRYPDGIHADAARLALDNPQPVSRVAERDYPLSLFGPLQAGNGHATQSAAESAALAWARSDADAQCRRLKLAQQSPSSVAILPDSLVPACEQIGSAWYCTVEGEAECRVAVPTVEEVCRIEAAD